MLYTLQTCLICNTESVEDEIHFLCKCFIYKEPREKMFNEICLKVKNFASLTDKEKFEIMLRDFENLIIDY